MMICRLCFHTVIVSALVLALAQIAGATDCNNGCGGCVGGRCDLSPCPAGLYCCLGIPGLMQCCSSCEGHHITHAPTPGGGCDGGTNYTSPWTTKGKKKETCDLPTACKTGCDATMDAGLDAAKEGAKEYGLCKAMADGWPDDCVDTVTGVAEAAALIPGIGDLAAAAALVLGDATCVVATIGSAYLCTPKKWGWIWAPFEHMFKEHVCEKNCEPSADSSSWFLRSAVGGNNDVFDAANGTSSLRPIGFSTVVSVSAHFATGNRGPVGVTTVAFNGSAAFLYRTLTLVARNGKSNTMTHKITTPRQEDGSVAQSCSLVWNGTECSPVYSQAQGFPTKVALPKNLLDYFLTTAFNLTAGSSAAGPALVFSHNVTDPATGNNVSYFYSTANATAPSLLIEYAEERLDASNAIPRSIWLLSTNVSAGASPRELLGYTFVNMTAGSINESEWIPPSFCPTESKTCGFECNGLSWGQCPPGGYGAALADSPTYGDCARQFYNMTSACPQEFPYCVPRVNASRPSVGECSEFPVMCPSTTPGGSVYFCPTNYPCCGSTDDSCRAGPCAASAMNSTQLFKAAYFTGGPSDGSAKISADGRMLERGAYFGDRGSAVKLLRDDITQHVFSPTSSSRPDAKGRDGRPHQLHRH